MKVVMSAIIFLVVPFFTHTHTRLEWSLEVVTLLYADITIYAYRLSRQTRLAPNGDKHHGRIPPGSQAFLRI